MTIHVLGPKGATALEGRGLCLETVVRFGIYTGRAAEGGGFEPHADGSVVAFPFVERGAVVAEKYRAPGKKFWQRAGGRRTFWNADALDDPLLASGAMPLVITEGEIDALTAIDCGFPLTVSVPDGAPAVQPGENPEALPAEEPEREGSGKFEFLWNNRDRLKRIRRFVLAVDNDPPGRRLAAELVRRLGAARCSFVTYPDGCKDLNDVLQRDGRDAVVAVLDGAKPYPLKGVYKLSDYPDVPDLVTYRTGWSTLDRHMQLFAGEFIVVTGIPNHGKALALDTEVPTPAGWTMMGALQVGDTVYDEQGLPCRVTKVSDIATGRPCYRVRFDDGTSIVADADHQWVTNTEKARRSARAAAKRGRTGVLRPRGSDQSWKRSFPSVVTTKEIAGTLHSQGKFNHQIALPAPVAGTTSVLPVEPYALGVWLGDGTSADGSITCFDEPIIEALVANGTTVSRQGTIGRFTLRGLLPSLRKLGVVGNKHVPAIYQSADIGQRERLLAGLMDSDGSCRAADRVCEFTTIYQHLAAQVHELVCGLGFKATLIEDDATLYGRVISRKYRVCFTADRPIFALPRKLAAQRIGTRARSKARVIVACDLEPSVPVRCIEVDSPSHLFLVTRAFIPTHNSTFVTHLLVNMAELHGWRSAIFSPEMPIVPQYRDKIRRIRLRRPPVGAHDAARADEFIEEHFRFIDSSVAEDFNEEATLSWVVDRATDMLLRDGIDVLVIDPWNEVEHSRGPHESAPDYIGRAIRMLKRFAKERQVVVIVVAHPTKEVGKEGKGRMPTPYDVESSAHWYNKPDHIIIVHRPDEAINETVIRIAKVRFEETGEKGHVSMAFNKDASRYEALDWRGTG